ncbi:hypothetical protein JAAARDRAFT_195277 [Jaapia argillacea MUCL 33604]|uniref:Uncharacterized protein n=1 Tax=Jaapia argillacea MUCL 33604 TaxID=933084 RepID=A0A067PMN6_9AGAM|nr:hypothetical protein JAAARDRAFT_195277 [Jaapia argillacea MUCL 33604]
MDPPFVPYTPPGSSTPHDHTSPIPHFRPPALSEHPTVETSATFFEIMHSARMRDCIRYWRTIVVQYGQIPPGLEIWPNHYIFCMALTGSHGWRDVGDEGQRIWKLAYEKAREIFHDPTSSLAEECLADTHQMPPMTFPAMGSSSQPSSSRAPATFDPPVLISGAGPSGHWRGRRDGDSSSGRVQQLPFINDPRLLAARGHPSPNTEQPAQDYRQTSSPVDGSPASSHYPDYSFEHGTDWSPQSALSPGELSNYLSDVTYPTYLTEQPLGYQVAHTSQTGSYMAQHANPPWPAAEVSGDSVPAPFPYPGTTAHLPPDGAHYAHKDSVYPGTFSLGSDSDAVGDVGQQSMQTSSFDSWDMSNEPSSWYLPDLDQRARAEQLQFSLYPYQPYDFRDSQAPQ